jgi:hypothetical protein
MKMKCFYQGKHVKEKDPSIDIHEEISFHQLAYVIGADQGEVDQQPASTFHSPVLSTDIQPDVRRYKKSRFFVTNPVSFVTYFMTL